MADFSSWAQRRAGRGGQPPGERAQPATAAPSRPAQQLPLPPPGYAWTIDQYGRYMAVPLAPPAPATTAPIYAPPPRQPAGLRPFVPQPLTSQMPPGHATARVETCVLVKPGDKDTYGDMLANLPDLVPDNGGYDAMAGNPSPLTVQECGGSSEFAMSNDGQSMRAYPEGAVLSRGSMPLKGSS
jgi:hypothetical protein